MVQFGVPCVVRCMVVIELSNEGVEYTQERGLYMVVIVNFLTFVVER